MVTNPRRALAPLVVLVLLAVACGGNDDPPRVLVVGDSITNLVADDIAELDRAPRFALRATSGATVSEMAEEVDELDDPSAFDQVVLNLGTNDGMDAVPFEETSAALDALVGRFADAECIHLTTVNEHVFNFDDPDVADRMARINDHIESVAADDDRVRLIEWSAFVGDYQEAGEPDGPLLTDTIHPTEVGQAELLDLYLDAVAACS